MPSYFSPHFVVRLPASFGNICASTHRRSENSEFGTPVLENYGSNLCYQTNVSYSTYTNALY